MGGELEFTSGEPLPPGEASRSLASRFGVPPFSILDTRQGYWQERRRAWLDLGIRSEVGRGENLLKMSDTVLAGKAKSSMGVYTPGAGGVLRSGASGYTGTSVFDPVLCELIYRWFSPGPGARVLDPFAGGSVRGVVAAKLGRRYVGIELREEQVVENQAQADEIVPADSPRPSWLNGDSSNLSELLEGAQADDEDFDLVFSCPPYHNLEVYSDDPADLSNLSWEEFLVRYRAIIAAAVSRLRANRFAVFVVTEIRNKAGTYKGFVPETIKAFEDAGAAFYNEAILVNSAGSLPLRAGRIFQAARKLGRCHQNVLVFFKGSPDAVAREFEPVDIPADAFGAESAADIEPGEEEEGLQE